MKDASIAIFRHQGRILLGERIPSGRFGPPGGKVEPGESPEQALTREVMEETGIDALEYYLDMIIETPDDWRVHVYEISHYEGEPENREPNKCKSWEWIPEEDLSKIPILYSLEAYGNKHQILK